MKKMTIDDILLKQSLTPDDQPEESLNQAILERLETEDVSQKIERLEHSNKWRRRIMLSKVAAIISIILVVGTGTVYAAGRMLNQVYIYKHGISNFPEAAEFLDNPSYDEGRIMDYPGEIISMEAGGPDDKWLSKIAYKATLIDSGTYVGTHTKYAYIDYMTAVSDKEIRCIFQTIPGEAYQAFYDEWEHEEREDAFTKMDSLSAKFRYKNGWVKVTHQFGNPHYLAVFGNGSMRNERKYTSKSGIEYTLVDWGSTDMTDMSFVTTIVLISFDNESIEITFDGLSEQEIQEVLDMIDL